MENSDDKLNIDGTPVSAVTENTSVENGADGGIAPASDTKSSDSQDGGDGSFALVGVAVKSVAVTLALILLITSILAVGLPLQAMRTFNKLGMTARAVDFGERYISGVLDDYDAAITDDDGNYTVITKTHELTNDDFLEALYVCIQNSYRIMNDSFRAGDTDTCEYYARRVEKYTRMSSSLNGIGAVNKAQSERNVAAMPLYEMRPLVYSYGHTVYNMNFRARVFLGETNKILFNSYGGNAVTLFDERMNTFDGIDIAGSNRNALIANLDGYVDYIDAFGEYLDVEFIKSGIINDMSEKFNYNGMDIPIFTETAVRELYYGKLTNRPFDKLVTVSGDVNSSGFTVLYRRIKDRFAAFAKYAIDFVPSDNNNNKLDEQLHQLYWLQTLRNTAAQLTYVNYLLYFNSENYGTAASKIRDEQFDLRDSVAYDALTRAYIDKLTQYKQQFQTV